MIYLIKAELIIEKDEREDWAWQFFLKFLNEKIKNGQQKRRQFAKGLKSEDKWKPFTKYKSLNIYQKKSEESIFGNKSLINPSKIREI